MLISTAGSNEHLKHHFSPPKKIFLSTDKMQAFTDWPNHSLTILKNIGEVDVLTILNHVIGLGAHCTRKT